VATAVAATATVKFTSPALPAGHHDNLVHLHESIAELFAKRGQWHLAFQHLRAALSLLHERDGIEAEEPAIPEQLRREVDRLRREHAEAQEQSIRDSLTAAYNRRYLDQRLGDIFECDPELSSQELSIAIVDLDWFKQVNDTFGHLIGDRVLQQIATMLSENLPAEAFCARYGGEEFVLVLPHLAEFDAVTLVEATRARIEGYDWSRIASGLRITISVGLSHGHTGENEQAERHLRQADGLLYAAKQSGRNSVAYTQDGRVLLAGPAAGRRTVVGAPRISAL
jgi:diguanylate cyclase (GGDEF)-like protein